MATLSPVKDRPSRWRTGRIAVPVLTLFFVFAPAMMVFPRHEQGSASTADTRLALMQVGVHETCPPLNRCVDATIEQALPRLPSPPLLLLALAVLVLAVRWQHHTPARQRDWWWPPGPRRALLQVFLI